MAGPEVAGSTASQPYQKGDEPVERWIIEECLGGGSHARVYSVKQRFTGTMRALKVLHPERTTNRENVLRFMQEGCELAHLEHPNIVRVQEAAQTRDGVVFMLMELLQGKSLRACISGLGQVSVPFALWITVQVCSGLARVHKDGIIHRDIKPENLFVEPGGRAKILDFGIAKVSGSAVPTTQRNLHLLGSIAYMGPEQVQAETATPKWDLWAVGMVLWEMLAGQHPFVENFGQPHALLASILATPVPDIRRFANVPDDVAQLVHRLLAKDPGRRPATAEAVAEEAELALLRFGAEVGSGRAYFQQSQREAAIWRFVPGDLPAGIGQQNRIITSQGSDPSRRGPRFDHSLSAQVTTAQPQAARLSQSQSGPSEKKPGFLQGHVSLRRLTPVLLALGLAAAASALMLTKKATSSTESGAAAAPDATASAPSPAPSAPPPPVEAPRPVSEVPPSPVVPTTPPTATSAAAPPVAPPTTRPAATAAPKASTPPPAGPRPAPQPATSSKKSKAIERAATF